MSAGKQKGGKGDGARQDAGSFNKARRDSQELDGTILLTLSGAQILDLGSSKPKLRFDFFCKISWFAEQISGILHMSVLLPSKYAYVKAYSPGKYRPVVLKLCLQI